MSWFAGVVVASALVAVIVMRLFDYVFSGLVGSAANATKNGLFVGVWTAVTTYSGMREVAKRIRKLRQRTKVASGLIDIGSKKERG